MQLKSHRTVEQIAKKHRLEVSFIKNQLKMGIPIEHEHTRNKTLATDIALQHLDEIPDYYTRLKKMEASAKKEHRKFKDVKEDAVTDLQRGITELPDASYGSIDNLMNRISRMKKVSTKKLHNDFVDKHNQTPDTWAKKSMKEEKKKTLRNTNPCWKGYTDIGTKKKNGRTVPNCVPVKEVSEMKRYCPKCAKEETRDECKYGQKYWDMFSMPITLKDYTPNTPHPGNMPEERGYDETSIEDANGNTFLRIIDIIKPERLVKETISPTISGGKSPYKNPSLPKENPDDIKIRIIQGKDPQLPLAKGEGGSPGQPYNAPKEDPKNPYVPAPKRPKVQLAHYESEGTYIEEQVADTDTTAQEKFDRRVNAAAAAKTPEMKIKILKSASDIHPSKLKTLESFMIEASAAWQRKEGKNNDPNSRINKSLGKWNC
jgi:hypothetical protein